MSLCDRCKNKCKFMLKNKTLDACSLFEKYTNFDRITASPEVLAEILTDIQTDGHFGVDCMTYEERLEWLKQESKK